MSVHELNHDQIVRLKQEYIADLREGNVSWGELAAADEIICDEEIYSAYEGVDFVPEDF